MLNYRRIPVLLLRAVGAAVLLTAIANRAIGLVQAITLPGQTVSASAIAPGRIFSGQSVRFTLPEGYQVLEGLDGGCFLYHESLPGFLVLYPEAGEPDEIVTRLLNATADLRHIEPPLEVDLGRLTFVGLFVETDLDRRLFLAAANGWALVVQGPIDDWPILATGFNRVLMSISFKED